MDCASHRLLYALSCLAIVSWPAVGAANPDSPAPVVKQATPKDAHIWARYIQQSYPAQAARENLQGSVRIRVIVDKAGRVSSCFVQGTSGHPILDQAACDGMQRFALFNPAIDASGSPTIGSYATLITYKFKTPPPVPLGAPGAASTTI